MARLPQLIRAALGLSAVCLLPGACRSTPTPDVTLVSVSWVNPTPAAIPYIQTTLCDGATASVESLPAYSEVPVPTRQSLTRNCRVETSWVQNGETRSLGTDWLNPPARKSQTGEYNLRVRLQPGAPPRLHLEPVQNLRARMRAVHSSANSSP